MAATEVDAVTKLYDYILWMIPKLEQFPKRQKYLLGDRIENSLLDILELLIDASFSKEKRETLKRANIKLQQLRYLIRLSKDLKLISMKHYEKSSKDIDGVGRSVGGWLKSRKQ